MAKTVLYPSFANPPQGFSGPIQQSAQWRQPWSEPVRSKIAPRLAIALIASGLFAPVPVPAPSTAVIVETASSEVIFPRSFIYQSQTWVPVVTTASTAIAVPTNWGSPPPQRKRVLYQSKAYAPFAPITVDRWTYPWSEPVRVKKGLGAHLQDFGAPDAPFQPPPVVLNSNWIYPWSEPVRLKKGMAAQLQDVGAPDVILPPPVLNSNWTYPWSEPVRTKRFGTQLQDIGAPDVLLPSPVLSSQWHQPWTNPVGRKGISVTLQQSLAWSTFTPAVTPTTTATAIDTFTDGVVFPRSFIYQASTKPVFVPTAPTIPTFFNLTQGDTGLIFRKSLIYQVNTDPIGVTAPFSYLPWSEPIRRIGFPVRLQQTLAWSTFTPAPPPVVIFESMWHQPWSGPVRFRRFNTALQSSTSLITPPQPNFTRTISWYQPYSEPVRKKKGIGAWLQQAFGIDTKPPAQPSATLVMSVTEVNSDTFLGAIRTVNPAAYVRVSIKEIQVPGAGLTSIEET